MLNRLFLKILFMYKKPHVFIAGQLLKNQELVSLNYSLVAFLSRITQATSTHLKSSNPLPFSELQCFPAGLHTEPGFKKALHLPGTFLKRGRDDKIKGLFVAPSLYLPLVPTLQKVIILTIQFNWGLMLKTNPRWLFSY